MAGQALSLQKQHPMAPGSEVIGASGTGSAGTDHDHVMQVSGAHTLRMSASFSASSFSISVMNLSVSFWILSCSSRL